MRKGNIMPANQVQTIPTPEALLSDPCTSHWLKGALRWALERDIVDTLNDVELLLKVLEARYDETIKQQSSKV